MIRDEHGETLLKSFQDWNLPADAIVFLLKIWDAIQFLDDIKDGHTPSNMDGSIYTLIVGIPSDGFLGKNREILSGALVAAYHKWQAANVVESAREESALDKAYMWRAGYYDLVMLVVALCLSREDAEMLGPKVMALYGEKREDYLKEIIGA